MAVAVAAVAGLAYWDADRESSAVLEDFGAEQATLAKSVAGQLAARLARPDAGGDPAPGVAREAGLSPELSSDLARLERPGSLRLLVRPPGGRLLGGDGEVVRAPTLEAALAAGASTARLPGAEAAGLGLPNRVAMAGLARVRGGPGGPWEIAVVASAERERNRERRARLRLVLAVSLAAGLVVGFGGVALEKQRAELELERELAVAETARERDERLARLSRAATMVTMASGVAHEISTPLGVISGRAEQILERAQGDERLGRAAGAILEQAGRIRDVIRGFLDLARGGSPTLQEVAPEVVVREALAMVEHRFAAAGVSVGQAIAAGLPPFRCDPRLLEHALVNLLLNACDASREGGAVEVRVSPEPGAVRFVVTDQGEGIAAASAARVGEPFFTTKPQGKGTGLGLAIVGEIVKSHRGSFEIRPGEIRGTRASIVIPLPETGAMAHG